MSAETSRRLIVFDFDGTLVNSRRLIVESNRIVFAQFGLTPPPEAECLALIGRSLEVNLRDLAGPGAPIAEMMEAFGSLLPELRRDVRFCEEPFEGTADLLAELAALPGVMLGIATGHVAPSIAPALETLMWHGHFATVQTADRAPSKPHPGMLLQALDETGTRAEDAIMIGDTAFDMEMACAAKVGAIGVSWGYHEPDRLRAAGARHVARDMSDLSVQVLGFARREY